MPAPQQHLDIALEHTNLWSRPKCSYIQWLTNRVPVSQVKKGFCKWTQVECERRAQYHLPWVKLTCQRSWKVSEFLTGILPSVHDTGNVLLYIADSSGLYTQWQFPSGVKANALWLRLKCNSSLTGLCSFPSQPDVISCSFTIIMCIWENSRYWIYKLQSLYAPNCRHANANGRACTSHVTSW